VATTTRALDRAEWLTKRSLHDLESEFRERRLALGLSQAHVAAACRISRPYYGRIESGAAESLSIANAQRIASVLGLAVSIRVYPEGVPIRDAGHATKLRTLAQHVAAPLTIRLEVPLPIVEGRAERRAWDAVLYRGGERCAVELEMRLRDVQATLRRIELKRRDDPTTSFLLVVADTRANRRVLAEFEPLFADLPRLRPSRVRRALEAGALPPTGLLLT
jgi:transcriptional regulator with XRE-family HTH domain